MQTAVDWDQECRDHLNTMRSARFTSGGMGKLRTDGINSGASYVQSTWLSRAGSGNASVPLAVPYGTTSIPLQINDVIFLCGPLVASDIAGTSSGCRTSVTAARLVDDTARWVRTASNANDRSPNDFGAGCMYPAKSLVRRKIVKLEVDLARTTYDGSISGGTGSQLLSRRQNSTRYWLSTPTSVTYRPQNPITTSGSIYIKMTYKSYSGYHSANETEATKICDATDPRIEVSGAALNIDRCENHVATLRIQIVLLDNYTLVPGVSATPSSLPEGVGGNVTVTPSVNNTGTTATSENINWRVTRFEVAPGTNYSVGGTPADPCTQITGEKAGSCTTIKSGSNKFNTGTTQLGAFANSVAANLPAGTKVCYVTSVEKGSSASATWRHSSIDCVLIERAPLVHILGNDARAGSGFVDTPDALASVMGSVSIAGGSTGEYGLIAPSTVSGFSSSAGAINGSTAPQASWSALTFANTFSVTPTCAPKFGCFGSVGKIPNILQFLQNPANSSIIEQCNMNAQNISISALASYTCANGRRLNDAAHDVDKYKQSTILYTTGTVTIDKDIKYVQDSLQYDSEIPQLIIAATDIVITEPVQQVDAWLLAKGKLSTCNINPPLTVNQCNRQLTMNGPVMATKLQLNRTYYDSTKKDAAEVMNLRPSSYIWAYQQVRKKGTWQTTYVTELPPRY